MAITHSLMFIQVATEEEEKLTSLTFSSDRKWPQQTQSHHSSLTPGWLCLSINSHPPQLPRLHVYPLYSGRRRDFICVPQAGQQRARQQFQCFHTKPFHANQKWVQEENGRGADLVEVLQPVSQLETLFYFSLCHGRIIERVLLKPLLVHLCSAASHYE